VAISFTGTDHVDIAAARSLGIAVANVPAYATSSVAELTLGMILSLLRRIVDCDRAVRQGTWREGLTGTELEGRTCGIVGTGAIGLAVARRLAAFGCPLLGWSRSRSESFLALGGTYVELRELLSGSDVISLHVPLTDRTRGLIGTNELALVRPHALLVNTARGPVVDAAALAAALHENRLGGAAIDVHDVEPVPQTSPLLGAPRTLLLPHVAFATTEALSRKAVITVDNIRAFLDGERRNRVDTRG
jgi:D-3-phosphoglycerate dehydrogenase